MSILPFIVIMLGFFFFTSRSQKKKQKEHDKMLSSISPGDTVVSAGGFFGKVSDVLEDSFIIEIADGVRARILKSSISGKREMTGNKPRPGKPKKKRRRPVDHTEHQESLAQGGHSEEPKNAENQPDIKERALQSEEVTVDESSALIDAPIEVVEAEKSENNENKER
jgi:preprotein translocase subunit YajC